MKIIKINNTNVCCLVDDEDYPLLSRYNWHQHRSLDYIKNEKLGYIHRIIMGAVSKKQVCDHIDGNKLNNQKSNLRLCTHSENMRNRKPSKYGTSKYLGVCVKKDKYVSQITHNRNTIYLGTYLKEVDAAKAYNEKAIELNGEYARLNIMA